MDRDTASWPEAAPVDTSGAPVAVVAVVAAALRVVLLAAADS